MAGILMAMLVACERKDQPVAEDPPPAPQNQGAADVPSGDPEPGKDPGGPVLIEKKPPVAEPVPGQPGFVMSPYNGKIIDVKGIPAGSLVADPTYPAAEKKHFRVPEMPDAPVDPSKLLDPAILINPGGAKEKPAEPEPPPPAEEE